VCAGWLLPLQSAALKSLQDDHGRAKVRRKEPGSSAGSASLCGADTPRPHAAAARAAASNHHHTPTARTQVVAHGKALLGYAVLGPMALLLLAEGVRVSGMLPGGHLIKTVTQSKWVRIPLQVRAERALVWCWAGLGRGMLRVCCMLTPCPATRGQPFSSSARSSAPRVQQPELDPTTQATMKAEFDRGVDKTTSFPVDGARQ
jgi:hypothetical protein